MALWQVGKLKPARVWGKDSHWSGGAFSPDGKRVLSGVLVQGKFHEVLWELRTGKEVWRVPDWGAHQFTPDGKQLLAMKYADGHHISFGRLDAATGKLLWETGKQPEAMSVSFSADGRRAVGTWGALHPYSSPGITVQLWSATDGKPLRKWQVPEEPPKRIEKP
jgi:hypothetical protein